VAEEILVALIRAMVAGGNRNLGGNHDVLTLTLAAHSSNSIRRWSDELDAIIKAHLAEVEVLREEAIARMHSLSASSLTIYIEKSNGELDTFI
jgi:hypothetical protein